MAAPTKIRTSTPLINRMRNMFFGRPSNNPLRFEQMYSPRTLPPANLPDGVSHKLADNYYLTRDGRRECNPPIKAYISGQKVIESGEKGLETKTTAPPKAGFGYDWTTGKQAYH